MSGPLDSYMDSVRSSQELDFKQPISCTQPEHAVEIYKLFFRKAKGEILMYQNLFQGDVFVDVEFIREMERAVYRNVNFELIAQRPDEGSEFFERLEMLQARTPFAHYFEIPKNTQSNRINPRSFLVVDSKAFRLENKDGEAIAYFNNPNIARQLTERFVSIRRKLEGIRSI